MPLADMLAHLQLDCTIDAHRLTLTPELPDNYSRPLPRRDASGQTDFEEYKALCYLSEGAYDYFFGKVPGTKVEDMTARAGTQYHTISTDNTYYNELHDSRDGATVLAFRGTASLKDVGVDLNALSVPFHCGTVSGCVHGGMLRRAEDVYASITATLDARGVPPRIVLTGHSLGAGLATLIAFMLRRDYPDLPIELVGFSTPRVCSEGLADFAERHFDAVTFFNRHDGVTMGLEMSKGTLVPSGRLIQIGSGSRAVEISRGNLRRMGVDDGLFVCLDHSLSHLVEHFEAGVRMGVFEYVDYSKQVTVDRRLFKMLRLGLGVHIGKLTAICSRNGYRYLLQSKGIGVHGECTLARTGGMSLDASSHRRGAKVTHGDAGTTVSKSHRFAVGTASKQTEDSVQQWNFGVVRKCDSKQCATYFNEVQWKELPVQIPVDPGQGFTDAHREVVAALFKEVAMHGSLRGVAGVQQSSSKDRYGLQVLYRKKESSTTEEQVNGSQDADIRHFTTEAGERTEFSSSTKLRSDTVLTRSSDTHRVLSIRTGHSSSEQPKVKSSQLLQEGHVGGYVNTSPEGFTDLRVTSQNTEYSNPRKSERIRANIVEDTYGGVPLGFSEAHAQNARTKLHLVDGKTRVIAVSGERPVVDPDTGVATQVVTTDNVVTSAMYETGFDAKRKDWKSEVTHIQPHQLGASACVEHMQDVTTHVWATRDDTPVYTHVATAEGDAPAVVLAPGSMPKGMDNVDKAVFFVGDDVSHEQGKDMLGGGNPAYTERTVQGSAALGQTRISELGVASENFGASSGVVQSRQVEESVASGSFNLGREGVAGTQYKNVFSDEALQGGKINFVADKVQHARNTEYFYHPPVEGPGLRVAIDKPLDSKLVQSIDPSNEHGLRSFQGITIEPREQAAGPMAVDSEGVRTLSSNMYCQHEVRTEYVAGDSLFDIFGVEVRTSEYGIKRLESAGGVQDMQGKELADQLSTASQHTVEQVGNVKVVEEDAIGWFTSTAKKRVAGSSELLEPPKSRAGEGVKGVVAHLGGLFGGYVGRVAYNMIRGVFCTPDLFPAASAGCAAAVVVVAASTSGMHSEWLKQAVLVAAGCLRAFADGGFRAAARRNVYVGLLGQLGAAAAHQLTLGAVEDDPLKRTQQRLTAELEELRKNGAPKRERVRVEEQLDAVNHRISEQSLEFYFNCVYAPLTLLGNYASAASFSRPLLTATTELWRWYKGCPRGAQCTGSGSGDCHPMCPVKNAFEKQQLALNLTGQTAVAGAAYATFGAVTSWCTPFVGPVFGAFLGACASGYVAYSWEQVLEDKLRERGRKNREKEAYESARCEVLRVLKEFLPSDVEAMSVAQLLEAVKHAKQRYDLKHHPDKVQQRGMLGGESHQQYCDRVRKASAEWAAVNAQCMLFANECKVHCRGPQLHTGLRQQLEQFLNICACLLARFVPYEDADVVPLPLLTDRNHDDPDTSPLFASCMELNGVCVRALRPSLGSLPDAVRQVLQRAKEITGGSADLSCSKYSGWYVQATAEATQHITPHRLVAEARLQVVETPQHTAVNTVGYVTTTSCGRYHTAHICAAGEMLCVRGGYVFKGTQPLLDKVVVVVSRPKGWVEWIRS